MASESASAFLLTVIADLSRSLGVGHGTVARTSVRGAGVYEGHVLPFGPCSGSVAIANLPWPCSAWGSVRRSGRHRSRRPKRVKRDRTDQTSGLIMLRTGSRTPVLVVVTGRAAWQQPAMSCVYCKMQMQRGQTVLVLAGNLLPGWPLACP
jgi:hypothetical protein